MVKFGVTFSGGIAKGAYQIGFCNALCEFVKSENISTVSGASIGSISAYALATDQVKKAEELWKSIDIRNVIEFTRQRFYKETIDQYIEDLTTSKSFSMDCIIPCVSVKAFKLHYFNLKEIDHNNTKKVLFASISLPPILGGVVIDGEKYIDAAVIKNIPIEPVIEKKPDYIVLVHFDSSFVPPDTADSILIEAPFSRDNKFIRSHIRLTKENISNFIEEGYLKGMEIFRLLFKNGIEDKEYIRHQLSIAPKQERKPITMDRVVSNVNKLANVRKE